MNRNERKMHAKQRHINWRQGTQIENAVCRRLSKLLC